jgi:hypothetical protein
MVLKLSTTLGKWFISKMEELLVPSKILVKSAWLPLLHFAQLQGIEDFVIDR